MFYTSRFNRDNLHDPAEGEDIDNSYKYRIYNKSDIKELMTHFLPFFEWAINAKNLSRIYLTDDITLIREATPPRIKYATTMDEKYAPGQCKAGEYYITNGRYSWKMWVEGETFERMRDLWMEDPEYTEIRDKLIPEMEEKNKNAKSKHTN